MKKTKLSGIVDNSSYGFTLGTSQMEIDKTSEKDLRRMLKGCEYAYCISGDAMRGDCSYQIRVKDEMLGAYEFRQQGSSRFLNASVNPTKIATGENDIPVLIKGLDSGENAAMRTFQYLNRMPYALLEFLPSEYPFQWRNKSRDDKVNGEINLTRLQMAWYSGDLGNYRKDVMSYLRACYSGISITKRRVVNIGSALGIRAKLHDNHDQNMTLEAGYDGNDRLFSLTMYCKDEHPEYEGSNSSRLDQLIRFDVSLYSKFLRAKKIQKVRELELRYKELCEESGYDTGFMNWIKSEVVEALKMDYVLALDSDSYCRFVAEAEEMGGKNERKMLDYWLKMDTNLGEMTLVKMAETLGLSSNVAAFEAIKNIKNEIGLDITVPRWYHVDMLFNRISGTMSTEERDDYVSRNRHNKQTNYDELIERDVVNAKKVRGALSTSGSISLRKLKPKKIKADKLWVFSVLNTNKQFEAA